MSDTDTKLFDIAEKVVRDALYCSDIDEAQYVDWDLVAECYDVIVAAARKGLA